jgi:hypothetical protein
VLTANQARTMIMSIRTTILASLRDRMVTDMMTEAFVRLGVAASTRVVAVAARLAESTLVRIFKTLYLAMVRVGFRHSSWTYSSYQLRSVLMSC